MPDRGTSAAFLQRRYFPICIKILGWLLANFAFLALAVLVLARFQFHFSPESFLEGRMGGRLEKIGSVLSAELQHAPQRDWTSLLECFTENGDLQTALIQPNGTILAGHNLSIPPMVRGRILRLSECCGLNPHEDHDSSKSGSEKGCTHRFLLRAGTPEKLWVGLRLIPTPPNQPVDQPVFLLFSCNSIRQSGFLFDWVPWLGSALAITACSVLFWTPLVRGIARSIHQMTEAASQIALGRFQIRVEEDRSDDLGRLGASINHMASRLDKLVAGQKRFLGDIAHELCSPLARMELALGVLEQRADPKHADYLQDVREEVRHMSNLLHELLSFTRAEIGAKPSLHSFRLSDSVARAIEIEDLPTHTLHTDVPSDLLVRAHPGLLERALCNLIRNAFRYAAHAGPIQIVARPVDGSVQIVVSDSGPGIPEDCIPHLFEPFYRPESHRDRESGGTGLGLAIVRSCIQNCGGTISAKNRSPSGLEMTIKLAAGS
jgi:two-component system sensor histidine kinase CpxA